VLDPEFDVPYGAFVPTAYAMVASRYVAETGATTEELAAIAVIERHHASAHPGAKMRTPITVGDVVGSPVIATPLHLLECCLVTDFSGALVMTTSERADDLDGVPVSVWGEAEAHDRLSLVAGGDSTRRGAARSGPEALKRAGIGLSEVDLLELYDSFTITVALTLEDLGICGRGEAGVLAGSGELAADGRWPLNTNGGMLSYRTGGVSHVIEAVHQLRGTASGLQVDSPHVALVHGIGGVLSTHCSLVLGKGDHP
jgi:acetyl-CoA acetyltransferase